MAKVQKYSEELMLEAVVRYAEVYNGKIKLTKLAKWAAVHMPGLEEVKSYMFVRPITYTDKKTGQTKKRNRLCTDKINEINKARNIKREIQVNEFLNSSNIDLFFEHSHQEQRNMIVKAREEVNELLRDYDILARKAAVYQEENQRLQRLVQELDEKLEKLQAAYDTLENHIGYILASEDEYKRQKEQNKIAGIKSKRSVKDDFLHIKNECAEAFTIKGTIRKAQEESMELFDEILMGIDFDEQE